MSKINTKIQLRHDTAENWANKNPVLLLGEKGIETDTGYEKNGDGLTSWNDLKYVSINGFKQVEEKSHIHDNKSVLDSITETLINAWNSTVTHISDTVKHVTSSERTLWNTVSNKVDKVNGKNLSSNDLTDTLKNNYDSAYIHSTSAHAPTDAEANIIEVVKVNGTKVTPTSKIVNITVPTKTSNLTNDSNFIKTTEISKVAKSGDYADLINTPTSLPANGGNADTVDGKHASDFAEASHTHDDIYYTELEIDTIVSNINNSISSHTGNTSNPHSVTKAQVGLGNVENKSSATIRGEITKSNVTTALGYTPLNQSLKGSASGLAELDSNGKVPSSQLPSFIDDVVEGYLSGGKFYKESAHTTEISGETGKIYIDLSTEKTYRWSGSAFVVISETLALGETSSTAYRGDRGKTAYDHSQSTHARTDATKVEKSTTNGNIKINGTETTVYTHPSGTNPHGTTKSDVGLGNVGNFKAVSTVANQGLSDTEKSNARANIGAGTSSFSGSYNDLSNKPTIPTVGNGTVTIKQAGTSKGTFTMNQSGNTTIELTDNNTTYPISYKTINDSYKTAYRTQTKGNTSKGDYISTIRNDTSGVSGSPQYGSGLAWGRSDTHGYLYVNYSSAEAYIGGGNEDKLNWVSGISLSGHTHSYAGSSSAGGSATSAVKLDSSAGSATQPIYFSGGKPVACTYTLEKSVPSNAVFTDTDTKVTQTVTGSNASYPLLLAPSGQTATATTTSYFDSGVTLNPSTNTIAANVSGNADTVDGKHATDLLRFYDLGSTQTNINNILVSGTYICTNFTNYPNDCPDGQGILEVKNYMLGNGETASGTMGTDNMWLKQYFTCPHNGKTYERYVAASTIFNWSLVGGSIKQRISGTATLTLDTNSYSASIKLPSVNINNCIVSVTQSTYFTNWMIPIMYNLSSTSLLIKTDTSADEGITVKYTVIEFYQ